MKWKVIVVGKPALKYARDGIGEYEKRLRRYTSCEIVYLKDAGSATATGERLRQASEGCFRIVLDERGDLPDTAAFRAKVDQLENDGAVKAVALLIGGADGHDAATREAADWVMGLGRLTLQHELALVVLLEQIYRIYNLKNGGPYHR
jgi:23S rRNA (pseudouridine1915-N3)-methyltransferase